MKKPNIFWHMIRWGFVSGTVLAMLYFAALQRSIVEVLAMLVSIDVWGFVAMFGGLPGAVLGAVNAFFLWFLIRRLPRPFTREAMQASRFGVYYLAFFITLFGALGLTSWIWLNSLSYFFFSFMFAIVPSLIAATAAIYASHRYLFRLRLHDEPINHEKLKAKPKHDRSRLEDSAEEPEIYDIEDNAMQKREKY